MRGWLVAAFLALSSGANAAEIDIQIDNFTSDRGIASAVMKVANTSSRRLSSIFIDCAFLDENRKAIDIGKAVIQRIDAGGYAYEKASIVATGREKFVECSVNNFSEAN